MRPAQKWISDYVAHMCGNLAAPVQADRTRKTNFCYIK